MEPADSFLSSFQPIKGHLGEGNRQFTSGDRWLWSVSRDATFQLGQVGLWSGGKAPKGGETVI